MNLRRPILVLLLLATLVITAFAQHSAAKGPRSEDWVWQKVR